MGKTFYSVVYAFLKLLLKLITTRDYCWSLNVCVCVCVQVVRTGNISCIKHDSPSVCRIIWELFQPSMRSTRPPVVTELGILPVCPSVCYARAFWSNGSIFPESICTASVGQGPGSVTVKDREFLAGVFRGVWSVAILHQTIEVTGKIDISYEAGLTIENVGDDLEWSWAVILVNIDFRCIIHRKRKTDAFLHRTVRSGI